MDSTHINDVKIAAQLGMAEACELLGIGNTHISMSKAMKKYGETTVRKWIKMGMKTEKRGGGINSKIFISVKEIIAYNRNI